MSAKNLDTHNRWRNRQVAFRLSPEEADLLDSFVKISGLTKQDYITQCLLTNSVVVQGNSRVYKALRDSMAEIHGELQRIEAGAGLNDELLEVIRFIAKVMDGMKEDVAYPTSLNHVLDDLRIGKLRTAAKFLHNAAVLHNDNTVGHAHELRHFLGDHEDGLALVFQLHHQLVHGTLHTDVHTAGGAVQNQNRGISADPLAKDHLLLVAAGELAHLLIPVCAFDGQRFNLRIHIPLFLASENQEISQSKALHAGYGNIVPDAGT